MSFDLSPVDPVSFDPPSLQSPDGGAVSASADPASLTDMDAISASPLAYFGKIVSQLGESMTAEGQSASQAGADPSHGVGDAIDMLDGIVSMMSLYATNDGAAALSGSHDMLGAPGATPALDTEV